MNQASDAPAKIIEIKEKDAVTSRGPARGFVHRVCTQCNNVFRVPADKFDAKQCPKCHKG
jgi:hypothetical protein